MSQQEILEKSKEVQTCFGGCPSPSFQGQGAIWIREDGCIIYSTYTKNWIVFDYKGNISISQDLKEAKEMIGSYPN